MGAHDTEEPNLVVAMFNLLIVIHSFVHYNDTEAGLHRRKYTSPQLTVKCCNRLNTKENRRHWSGNRYSKENNYS